MARGVYTVVSQAVSIPATNAMDIFELNTPSDKVVELISAFLGQSSDAGDAADELLRVRVRSGMTTSGSGGSTATPQKTSSGDAAAGTTVETNNTTVASGGTIVEHVEETFNVRGGWIYKPVPEERIFFPPSSRIVLNIPTGPADALTGSATLTFREYP